MLSFSKLEGDIEYTVLVTPSASGYVVSYYAQVLDEDTNSDVFTIDDGKKIVTMPVVDWKHLIKRVEAYLDTQQ